MEPIIDEEPIIDGIQYSIDAETKEASVLGYEDEINGHIIILEKLKYEGIICSVTSIGNYAFSGCSGLTSVIIPSSVTSIWDDAFSECSSLTSVTIPKKVTIIGYRAFSDCSSLTSIVVESSNPVYDSRENCNAIIETSSNELIVGCKNTFIPNSVATIGNSAFESCSSMTSIRIPNSATSLDRSALNGCPLLTAINLPTRVISRGEYTFIR